MQDSQQNSATNDDLNVADLKLVPKNSDSTASKRYKVLVVEDEEDSKEVLVSLLNTTGKYDVSSAVDGNDALAKLEAEKNFDLVLLDIVMPKLDGIETLRLLKADTEKYGDPIVLMLTNLGGDIAVETAISIGAQGYLMKVETEPEQLLKKIDEELAKRERGEVSEPETPMAA